jgi:hypothetical protein
VRRSSGSSKKGSNSDGAARFARPVPPKKQDLKGEDLPATTAAKSKEKTRRAEPAGLICTGDVSAGDEILLLPLSLRRIART